VFTETEDRPQKKKKGWELQIPLIEISGKEDSIYYLVPDLPIDLTLNMKDWVFIVLADPAPGQYPKIVLRPREPRDRDQ
jgi:hypothetical protein